LSAEAELQIQYSNQPDATVPEGYWGVFVIAPDGTQYFDQWISTQDASSAHTMTIPAPILVSPYTIGIVNGSISGTANMPQLVSSFQVTTTQAPTLAALIDNVYVPQGIGSLLQRAYTPTVPIIVGLPTE
jgi:hypothetical protein